MTETFNAEPPVCSDDVWSQIPWFDAAEAEYSLPDGDLAIGWCELRLHPVIVVRKNNKLSAIGGKPGGKYWFTHWTYLPVGPCGETCINIYAPDRLLNGRPA